MMYKEEPVEPQIEQVAQFVPFIKEVDTDAHGRPDAPTHGSSDMPVWGPIFQSLALSDTIAQARIDNVVAYINSIQVKRLSSMGRTMSSSLFLSRWVS